MNSAVKKGGLTDCSSDIPWYIRFESRHTADVATPLNKTTAQNSLIASERTCVTHNTEMSASEISMSTTESWNSLSSFKLNKTFKHFARN